MAAPDAKSLLGEFIQSRGNDLTDVDKKVIQILFKGIPQEIEEEDSPEHALFSPSASKRWLTCPGSIESSEGIENESSPAAEEGTYFHDLMEKLFLGESIEYIVSKAKDKKMEEAILFCYETVNSFPETVFYAEQKVFLTEDCWGTADIIMWDASNKSLRILDFKYGWYPVDAENNTQLQIYASAVFKLWKGLGIVPETIWGTIIQPHSKDGERIKSAQIKRAELVNIETRVREAERLHKEGNADLVAGNHCTFCPAIPICNAYFSHNLMENQNFFVERGAYMPAENFETDELSERLYALQRFTVWQKQAVRLLKDRLLEGEDASHHFLSPAGRIQQKVI